MLETPRILRYVFMSHPLFTVCDMSRDNATGAVNQQERLDAYLAGFVDGEGSFHVAVQRNAGTVIGWQLVPEFHVSQSAERRCVLDALHARLGCGRIQANHARSPDTTLVYVVRRRQDLLERVIPFFEAQPLLSPKQMEVETFTRIVWAMARGDHLSQEGFEELRTVALSMNGGGRYRRVHRNMHPESSETICRTPHLPLAGDVVKRWSDLHGDMQSQAEMPWPPSRT